MKRTKLVELICSLNSDEMKRLGEFVKSPFFNKSNYILKIYGALKKLYKNPKLVLNKEQLFDNIYGHGVYNDQKLRSLISDFVKLLEVFLFNICHNKIQKELILIKEFDERKCNKSFKELSKSLNKYKETNKFPGKDEYSNYTYFNPYLSAHESDKLAFKKKDYTLNSIELIDYLFVYSKLHLHNIGKIGDSPYCPDRKSSLWLMNDVILFIENNIKLIIENHKLIYLEYLIFKITTNFNDNHNYQNLTQFLKNHYNKLDYTYLCHIFYAFNSHQITTKSYSSDAEYNYTFFNIISFFEKRGFFEYSKFLQVTMFYNVISIGLSINEINFTEFFYKKYCNKLDSETGSDILNLAKSRIEIFKKEFDSAILSLQKVGNINYQVYLISRCSLSIIYYEKNYFEELEYLIDSTTLYLRRNKGAIGLNYYEYLNFFHILKKMNKIAYDNDSKYNIMFLENEMTKSDEIIEKSWLLQQIRKLRIQCKEIFSGLKLIHALDSGLKLF